MNSTQRMHWAWVILGVCFLNLFVNYSSRLGYGVVLPEMIRTMGIGRADSGSIYNAYLLTYIAVTPLTGFLTDRFGARRVITVCCFLLGIGTLLMSQVQNLWVACAVYALVGLGATGMWTPVITVVQRWFAFRRRGLALGILSTGYGLGFATMGVAFPWIVNHFDWRFAWVFLGIMGLIMTVANGGLLRSDPAESGYRPWGSPNRPSGNTPSSPQPKAGIPLRQLFANRHFWLIGTSYFAISYSLYGITTFMVDFAQHQLGFPMEKAALLATVHGIGQIIGVLSILPLSDYWGRKKTILISNACIAVALAGLLLVQQSWLMLLVLVGLLAIFYGVTFPIYGACAGDFFPREVMGTVIGAWTPFYGLGAIVTHWVTGLLRDSTGVYDGAFAINLAMAIIAFLLMSRVTPRSQASNLD